MPDLDSVVAAALITAHTIIHASPHSIVPVEKPEEVKRPMHITFWANGELTILQV